MVGNQNHAQYDTQRNLITAPPNPSASQDQVLGTPGQNVVGGASAVAAAGGADAEILGSRALAATAAALAALHAEPVTAENKDAQKAEIDKCCE